MTTFTLTVAATLDGYIARAPDHSPAEWVSAEEQELFFADVEAADWGVMGRHTHEAADRPDRHRVVFSSAGGGWRRPTQLWLHPEGLTPDALPGLVEDVHPLKHGLILGGTAVHDWFLAHNAINHLHLTVEPVTFGGGLPIFTGQGGLAPKAVFESLGFERREHRVLNAQGTEFTRWVRGSAKQGS